MPIEINEVVVRVSVEDPKPAATEIPAAPATDAAAKSSDKVVEQILQILRDKQER